MLFPTCQCCDCRFDACCISTIPRERAYVVNIPFVMSSLCGCRAAGIPPILNPNLFWKCETITGDFILQYSPCEPVWRFTEQRFYDGSPEETCLSMTSPPQSYASATVYLALSLITGTPCYWRFTMTIDVEGPHQGTDPWTDVWYDAPVPGGDCDAPVTLTQTANHGVCPSCWFVDTTVSIRKL